MMLNFCHRLPLSPPPAQNAPFAYLIKFLSVFSPFLFFVVPLFVVVVTSVAGCSRSINK